MNAARRPTLVLGLGEAGAELARSYASFTSEKRGLGILTQFVTIETSGCTALHSDLPPVEFADTYDWASHKAAHDVLVGAEDAVTALIADRLRAVTNAETLLEADRRGIPLDSQVSVLVVSALHQPMGSSSILPVLGFLNYLYGGPLLGQVPNVELLLFWPDLFEDAKDDKAAYARCAAALQELNRAVRTPTEVLGTDLAFASPMSWLISGTNPSGANIGHLRDLQPMILRALAARQAGNMTMGSYIMAAELEENRAYGSFGLCEIVADTDAAVEGLTTGLQAKWLGSRAAEPGGRPFQRAQMAVEAERLLRQSGAARPDIALNRSEDGTPIFTPFTFTAAADEKRDPGQFLDDLARASLSYEETDWLATQSQLAARREFVLDEVSAAFDSAVSESLDDPEKSAEYADALLSATVGEDSEYLAGEVFETPMTLDAAVRDARQFFEEAMGITASRDEAEAIAEDIKSKQELIQQKQQQLKELKAEAVEKERLKSLVAATPVETDAGADEAAESSAASDTETASEADAIVLAAEALELEEVDDSLGEASAESVAQDIADLKEQLAELRSRRKSIEASIRAANLSVRDKSKRDAARDQILAERESGAAQLTKDLHEANSALQTAERLYEAKLDELHGASQLLMIQAAISAAIAIAACIGIYFLVFLNPLAWAFFQPWQGWTAIAVGFFGWLIFAVIRLASRRSEVDELDTKRRNIAARKKSLMNQLYQHVVDSFALRFDWALRSLVFELVADVRAEVRARIKQLRRFAEAVDQAAVEKAGEWEEFAFPSHVFSRPLLDRTVLINEIERKNLGLEQEVKRLSSDYPYSNAFRDYMAAGTVTPLLQRVEEYGSSTYHSIHELTVNHLVSVASETDAEALNNLFAQAVRAAQPFVMLYGDGDADLMAEYTYVGMQGGQANALVRHLDKLSTGVLADLVQPSVFGTADPQRCTFYRFFVGLSLERLGLCRFAREQLEKQQDPLAFYVDPEARGEVLGPRQPAVVDELWETLVLGRALGLVPLSRADSFEFSGEEFAGLPSFERRVRSFGGASVRNALTSAVGEAMACEGCADLIDRAVSEDSWFDMTEVEFLNRRVDELRGWS